MQTPPSLRWLLDDASRRAWLAALPELVDGAAAAWGVHLETPFADAHVSHAIAGRLADGTEVVLKVQFPHRESEHEAAALAVWEGRGAVRLLGHDPARRALLLERCRPGIPLSRLDGPAALDVLIGLLPRLWVPAGHPFRSLADEAATWSTDLVERWRRAGRPFERRLVDAALDALRSLPLSSGPAVLLHQDLHADNVLAAAREPWLVIDPKPLAGEREFGVGPAIRSFELGHGRRQVLRRLDRLTADLGLDRERARRWSLAQTVAWSIGADRLPEHVEAARWLLETARE